MREDINLIYNFSSLELSDSSKSLLNKGLNFCPTPNGVNTTSLYADMFRMERKFAWKHFFKTNEYSSGVERKFPFSTKNQKTNLPKDYPGEIKEFVSSVKSEFLGTEYKQVHPNLSKQEREALSELISLQKAGRKADKG